MKSPYEIIDRFSVAEDLHIEALLTNQSPKWYLQYQMPGSGKGRQRRKSLGTTSKKEAGIRARRFAADFDAGRVAQGSAAGCTFDKLIDLRLEELRQAGAAENTLRLHHWYFAVARAVAIHGGRTPASALTPVFLTNFAAKIRDEGVSVRKPGKAGKPPRKPRPMAPKTVREMLKAVRRLGRIAEHFLGRDPAKGYKLPRGASPEIETFSTSELTQIFADPYPNAADIWRFLFLSGLRIGEFCWLAKADVVFNAAGSPESVHIRKKTIEGSSWRPKHGLERVVPLVPDAAEILARHLKAAPGPWAFTAPGSAGEHVGQWHPARVRAYLSRRLTACGIDHGTLHVFRHSCATHLANIARMPLPLLQKFLGHRSLETTMRYLHARNDDVAAALLAAVTTAALPIANAPPTNTPPATNGSTSGTPGNQNVVNCRKDAAEGHT